MITKLINENLIALDLKAQSKEEVFHELIEVLYSQVESPTSSNFSPTSKHGKNWAIQVLKKALPSLMPKVLRLSNPLSLLAFTVQVSITAQKMDCHRNSFL